MTNQTPPTLLSHRYKVICLLGDGGFGKTFLVEDTQIPSNRRCVVKQLKPIHDNPQIHQVVKDRFQREAAILERLGDSHEQIPQLYAYFSESEQFYLVEEWIEGDTLTEKVQREGVQSEETVRSILTQLLPTIAYVHQQQIVHRDIKPDNIILRRRDGKPVLIDFGAVKESMSTILNSQGNSSHSIVVGTPGYMPSEQLAGRPVFASDIYSLGMTAIYLLTGRIPQQLDTNPLTGELNWRQYAPSLSPEFAAVIDRAVHMQSHHRFGTAQEMLAALQSLSIAATLPPRPLTPLQSTILPTSSQPTLPPTPLPLSEMNTQAVAPVSAPNPAPQPASVPPSTTSGEWKKAVIVGGIIGVSILGGALMLRSQIPGFLGASNSTQPVASSPTPSEQPSSPATTSQSTESQSTDSTPDTPTQPEPPQPQIPSASEGTGTGDTNAVIIDKDSSTNVREGAGTNYNVKYTTRSGDRVRILSSNKDSGGYTWYRVFFPKSGAEGWIAAQLLKLDATGSDTPADPPKTDPPKTEPPKGDSTTTPPEPPKTEPPKAEDANATIVGAAGSKNIRTGPGTNYPSQHLAYPGDRVRILESAKDSGGYTWYKVYFPQSGADGWIAGQLIKLD